MTDPAMPCASYAGRGPTRRAGPGEACNGIGGTRCGRAPIRFGSGVETGPEGHRAWNG